jgi:hypothetical protein
MSRRFYSFSSREITRSYRSIYFSTELTCVVQNPSWKANAPSGTQQIPRLLERPNVHYRVHKSPPNSTKQRSSWEASSSPACPKFCTFYGSWKFITVFTRARLKQSSSWEASSCTTCPKFCTFYGTWKFITVFTRARLTTRSRSLIVKLLVAQLFWKFPVFYGTWKFITVFTRTRLTPELCYKFSLVITAGSPGCTETFVLAVWTLDCGYGVGNTVHEVC